MFALAAVMDNIPNGQPTPRESENKMSGVKKQTNEEGGTRQLSHFPVLRTYPISG